MTKQSSGSRLARLADVGDMIRDTLVDTMAQYGTLKERETSPYVLDEALNIQPFLSGVLQDLGDACL